MADRWGKLAVTAYLKGVLDFSKSSRLDYMWQLKENIVLSAVEDEIVTHMNELAHTWHCSAAQVTGWDEEETLFEHHRTMAHKAYTTIGRSCLPWYKDWKDLDTESLEKVWKEFKEREKDPEYAAYLKAERKRLRDLVEAAELDEKSGIDLQSQWAKVQAEKKLKAATLRKRREDARRR